MHKWSKGRFKINDQAIQGKLNHWPNLHPVSFKDQDSKPTKHSIPNLKGKMHG